MADAPGTWGGLQIRLTIPEVTDVVSALGSVLDLINTALDLGLTILQVVKTFTPPVLNPIKALLDELIALCRSALVDLRQLGLYAHFGDFKLLNSRASMGRLKGGYSAYQRRMITRLTDRRDLRRPDFSPSSTVLALFIYTAVDVSFVNGILDTSKFQSIRRTGAAFARLLGMAGIVGRNTSLPVPTGLRVRYPLVSATPGASPVENLALATSQLMGRSKAIVTWNLSPAPGAPDNEPTPVIPPAGFLVEVSCYPQGFYMGWMAPNPSSTGGESGGGSADARQSYLTGAYTEGDTGQPLQIFGGSQTVNLPESIRWANSFQGTTLREGATPAFFYRDPSRAETLHDPFPVINGRNVNQKVFFVSKASINLQALVGGTYTLELNPEDLPLYGTFLPDGTLDRDNLSTPTEVYVRVISVTDAVTEDNYTTLRWNPKPRRTDAEERVELVAPFGMETKGVPSATVKVMFPAEETNIFALALQTALALALLSRSDIVPPDPTATGLGPPTSVPTANLAPYAPTGLEAAMRDLVRTAVSNPQRYFSQRGTSPDAFTRDLFAKVNSLADEITLAQGNLPAALITARRDRFRELINWKWSDSTIAGAAGNTALGQTILGSITTSQSKAGTTVLARNIKSLRNHWANQGASTPQSLYLQALEDRGRTGFGPAADVVESAPLVYDPSGAGKVWYARHLVPQHIYDIAAEVLGITGATVSTSNGWVAWRPFVGTSALAANGRILQTVEGSLRSIAAGTEAAEAAILNLINFLEQRVKETQELVRRIKEYLSIPTQISIPDLVALPLLVNGTEGVVQGLVTAENRPTDGVNAYAGGLVLLGGGLPSILTDLLLVILSQS